METEAMNVARVVWHDHRINRYESSWSVLQKLCSWNRMGARDLWELFAIRKRSVELAARFERSSDALSNLRWLDVPALTQELAIPANVVANWMFDRYTFPTGHPAKAGTLQFCPRCLGRGYHSPIHNLEFLDRCPVDGETLVDACPVCGSSIPLGFNARDPFTCACGAILWDLTSFQALGTDEIAQMTAVVEWLDSLGRGVFGVGGAKAELENEAENGRLCDQLEFATGGLHAAPRNRERRLAPASSSDRNDAAILEAFRALDEEIGTHVRRISRERKGDMHGRAYNTWRRFWQGSAAQTAGWSQHLSSRFASAHPSSPTDENELPRWVRAVGYGTFLEIVLDGARYRRSGPERVDRGLDGSLVPFCFPVDRSHRLNTRALRRYLRAPFACIGDYCQ